MSVWVWFNFSSKEGKIRVASEEGFMTVLLGGSAFRQRLEAWEGEVEV